MLLNAALPRRQVVERRGDLIVAEPRARKAVGPLGEVVRVVDLADRVALRLLAHQALLAHEPAQALRSGVRPLPIRRGVEEVDRRLDLVRIVLEISSTARQQNASARASHGCSTPARLNGANSSEVASSVPSVPVRPTTARAATAPSTAARPGSRRRSPPGGRTRRRRSCPRPRATPAPSRCAAAATSAPRPSGSSAYP